MRAYFASAVTMLVVTSAALAQSEPIAVKPTYERPAGLAPDTTRDSTSRADSIARASRPNCWRAQPNPPCPGFFITEFGIEQPLLSTRRNDRSSVGLAQGGPGLRRDFGTRLAWTFGFMGTKGSDSHGATLSLSADVDNTTSLFPFTFEYRYRRWLPGSAAFDAALGYRKADVWKDGTGSMTGRGLTMMAGYTFNPYVGISVRGDLIHAAGRQRRAMSLGVRSTRLSEAFIKYTAIAVARAALAKIGIELEEDSEDQ